MSLDLLAQSIIIVCGASSVWLLAQRQHWRRWGYIVGLCAQPAWTYTTLHHEQYLILALTAWYAYSWSLGVWNFWIKPAPQESAP